MDEMTASEIPNFTFSVPLTKDTATTFARAVRKVVEHLESVWKSEQMVQFNEAESLVALVPVEELSQWQKIKGRMDRIPLIRSYYLQEAENIDRLQKEMNKRMLTLTVLPSGVFKLGTTDQVMYRPFGSTADQSGENAMMSAAEERSPAY